MSTSFSALCTDFYINQKLALKMDLPTNRETVLHMFDRVRKEVPAMDRFRRFEGELALESPDDDSRYSWFALTQTALRSGWVNPESVEQAYRLHKLIIEIAPFFLSISPIDVEYLELVFGFDLDAETNRNEIVFDALFGQSSLIGLIDPQQERLLDIQPFLGFTLSRQADLQAFVEVKTRTRPSEIASDRYDEQPISVYLTVRRFGPLRTIDELAVAFGTLAGSAERLAEERVLPHVVVPIREAILSRPM